MSVKLKHIIDRRDGELLIPFMMYEPVVRRSWQAQHKMDIKDWSILHWIYGWVIQNEYYSIEEFNAAESLHSWNPKRNENYIEKGWCKLAFSANRQLRQKNRWTMTLKGKLMVGEEYNKMVGFVLLNSSSKANPLMDDKWKQPAIRQMIQDKTFYRRAEKIKKEKG